MGFKRAWTGSGLALIIACTLVASVASAGLFGKKKSEYDTLIVTSNFVKSRMLAELIQRETKHPVLLLPTGDEADMMYALGPNGKAIEVHRDRYIDFVRNLKPKTIIFLGDANYVPPAYVAELQERFTVVEIKHTDWTQIADTAGELLDEGKLGKEYRRLLKELDGKGHPMPKVDRDGLFESAEDADVEPAAEKGKQDAKVKTDQD